MTPQFPLHRLVLLAAAAALLAALPSVAASNRRSAATLRVAVLVPSGGDFAMQNDLLESGAQIAADESGDAKSPVGGTKITLVRQTFAPGGDPAVSIAGVRRSDAQVVILPCNVDDTEGLAKAGAAAKLLMLSPCTPDASLPDRYPMLWPTAMAGNEEAAQLVTYGWQENATSAFLLDMPGSRYVATLTRYFRAEAKLDHVKIVGEASIPRKGANLASLANEIANTKAHAVFTAIFSPYAEPLIAGLRKHGLIAGIYVADGWDSGRNLTHYGTELDGTNYAVFGFPRSTAQEFQLDYRARFAAAPAGSLPDLGYETLCILEAALAKAGSTDASAIDAAFSEGFSLTGVALADVTYVGHGVRQPRTDAGVSRVVFGRPYPLFSSDPSGVIPVPSA
jgi:ABC-type branched-subunit amino acid transport system substrate-binding protein